MFHSSTSFFIGRNPPCFQFYCPGFHIGITIVVADSGEAAIAERVSLANSAICSALPMAAIRSPAWSTVSGRGFASTSPSWITPTMDVPVRARMPDSPIERPASGLSGWSYVQWSSMSP